MKYKELAEFIPEEEKTQEPATEEKVQEEVKEEK
jgi:hypothetical protein